MRGVVAIQPQLLKENSTYEEIEDAGIKLFLLNYNGEGTDTLGKLSKFMEMAASNTTIIDPALLPPSRRAAYFHSLRVYPQVSIWRQLNEGVFDPVEWGWKHYPLPNLQHQKTFGNL